jgi:hypothetical protein
VARSARRSPRAPRNAREPLESRLRAAAGKATTVPVGIGPAAQATKWSGATTARLVATRVGAVIEVGEDGRLVAERSTGRTD